MSKLRAGKCPGKSVLPLLRDEVSNVSADAPTELRISATAASILLEDRRISNSNGREKITCRGTTGTAAPCESRSSIHVGELPLPKLHEPVPSSHRAPHLDDRMDRFRSTARSFLSAFLDWVADQGRHASMPILQ